ncbi:hypothetical protein X975_25834, partial [Stegodyphus mimosarum]
MEHDSASICRRGAFKNSIRVFERHKRFRKGRDSVQDDPRADHPSIAHTDANVECVRQLLQENRRVTVRMISEELNLNRDVYRKILREDLGKRKLNAKTVPRSLTDEQKEERRRISVELLHRAIRDTTLVSKIIVIFSYFCESKGDQKESFVKSIADITRAVRNELASIAVEDFGFLFQDPQKHWQLCVDFQEDYSCIKITFLRQEELRAPRSSWFLLVELLAPMTSRVQCHR